MAKDENKNMGSCGTRLCRAWQGFSGAFGLGGVPIQVPVAGPKIFQFDQFAVAVGKRHVDRARQRLSGFVGNGAVGRPPPVPQNRATAHPVSLITIWRILSEVKIAGGLIGFQWECIGIVLIKKEWTLSRFQNGRKFWKNELRIHASS